MIGNTPPINAHTKYQGYGNEAFDVVNKIRGQLNSEGDINMELWSKFILDKTNQFNIGTPPVEEPSILPAIYFNDPEITFIDEDNNRTTYNLEGGSGDMLKSVYDTNNDGIVNSAHKELVAFINKTGATLTKGTIVYLNTTSSSGNFPEALKANASTETTSSKTIGAVYEDVAVDATGYIVTSGEVDNLNTSSYNVGTKLWLATTDGNVTTTAPSEPNHSVFIGTVTRSQTTNGRILYAIQNGYELEELHNVSSTDYTTIQLTDSILIKEAATSIWKPSTWSNIRSVLKTYFDSLYQPLNIVLTNTTASFTTALKSTYDSTASSLTTLLATGSRLITSTEVTKLSNTSGTNTGDQTSIVGISGTKTQFDTACTDGDFTFDGDSVTNLTMSTNKILGRSTASTGAVEEITIGSGLSLSGGTLSATGGSSSKTIQLTIPGTQTADSSNAQQQRRNNTGSTITISNVAVAVGKPATGTGAAYTVNIYKSSGTASDGINTNATTLFSSNIALGTSAESLTNVPTTTTVEAGRTITIRVITSAGATNFASDASFTITYT